jgi:hypothetical protein
MELPFEAEAAATTASGRRRRAGKSNREWPPAVRPPVDGDPLDDLDNFPAICTQHGVPNGLNIKSIILYGFDPNDPLRFTKKGGGIDRSQWIFYILPSLIRGGYPHERAKWLMTNPKHRKELLAFREEVVRNPAPGFELMPGHVAGAAADWLADYAEREWEAEFERQWEHAVHDVTADPVWAAHKLDQATISGAGPHAEPVKAKAMDGRTVISAATPRTTAQVFRKRCTPPCYSRTKTGSVTMGAATRS